MYVVCIGFKLTNGIICTAVVRTHVRIERNDRLAAEIVLVKQRVNDHREGVPPHGITDKNGIIVSIRACLRIWIECCITGTDR